MTPEDRRAEYTALRAEILDSDRTCLLMMGYLFAAVGFLYANDSEWLVSLLSFVGLCYFTEKRFSIRLISSHIASMGGFAWNQKFPQYLKEGKQNPCKLLHPFNVEAFTCLFVAVSPLFNGIYDNLGKLILDLWNYFDINNSNQGKYTLDRWNYLLILYRKFWQLNPNLTDCFWGIFFILTLIYSIYSLIKYNFTKSIWIWSFLCIFTLIYLICSCSFIKYHSAKSTFIWLVFYISTFFTLIYSNYSLIKFFQSILPKIIRSINSLISKISSF